MEHNNVIQNTNQLFLLLVMIRSNTSLVLLVQQAKAH